MRSSQFKAGCSRFTIHSLKFKLARLQADLTPYRLGQCLLLNITNPLFASLPAGAPCACVTTRTDVSCGACLPAVTASMSDALTAGSARTAPARSAGLMRRRAVLRADPNQIGACWPQVLYSVMFYGGDAVIVCTVCERDSKALSRLFGYKGR